MIPNQKRKSSWGLARFAELSSGQSFASKLFSVVGSASAAQFIMIASYPVITRLYDAPALSIFGAFTAMVSIIAAIIGFRADRILLFSEGQEERRKVLVSWFALTVIAASVLALTMLIWRSVIGSLGWPMFWVAFATAVGVAWLNIQMAEAARLLKTARVAISQTSRSLFLVVGQIASALIGASGVGLVAGWIVGLVAGIVVLPLASFTATFGRPSGAQIISALKEEGRGMIFGGGQAGINAFSNNMPVLVAALLLSPQQAGLYVLADRVMRLPINLISNTIRNYLAVMGRRDGVVNDNFVLKASLVLLLLSLVGALIIAAIGTQAFAMMFGESWRAAGTAASILSMVVVANMAALPYQSIIMSMRRYDEVLILEVFIAILRIAAFYWSAQHPSVFLIAIIFAVTSIIYYGCFVILYYKHRSNVH